MCFVNVQWLTKAGDERDLKEIIDIKSNILDVLEKHKRFNIAMSQSTSEAGETVLLRKSHHFIHRPHPQILYQYLPLTFPLPPLPPPPSSLILNPPYYPLLSTTPPERVSIPGRGNGNRTQPPFRLSSEHSAGKSMVCTLHTHSTS